MPSRSKGRSRTGAGSSDSARPDERMGDDLEELEDSKSAAGSDDAEGANPLLAEGEPVGPWSEEDEEPNAFDAASEDEDDLELGAEDVQEVSEEEAFGYQAASEPAPQSEPPPQRPGPKRRRSH
jgi:hypothetical protein